ncbi:uncharacterized protein LOC129773245 [Toxorhynchites rutilus septentrionalis]|uniref:uncharacterized protein LOC129773245 n=1 Tax=Toxorhynchites rutilus septentrionalis TaxID=329112 RepID=UPI00247A41A8|nr:uncharacterized protein LOC129773245 [Toxorhynchites rutilus septentrionalis]
MSKFDYKEAAAMVPIYDGSPDGLDMFISAATLLNEISPSANKALVYQFLLTRLDKKARRAINNSVDIPSLLTNLKTTCISKTSADSILAKLKSIKKQSADELCKEVEELTEQLIDLHIKEETPPQRAAKLACQAGIDALIEGIDNPELKTILRAGAFTSIADAVEKVNKYKSLTTKPANVLIYNRGQRQPPYPHPNRFNQNNRVPQSDRNCILHRVEPPQLSTFDWDDPISDDIARKWEEFAAQLTLLKGYKVPRFVFLADSISTQFHIFTDASEVWYGACLYTRSTGKEGQIKTELVAAKSRVAPLKRLSLPRLELCAALLGAKLYAKVSAALRMEGIPCWFWSDSTVTLHWIQAPPNTWQTFVGNRTSEIQQLTHGHSWNHVKGTENPADHVSRGMLPQEFVSNTIWRHGPSWLAKSDEYWPKHITGTPPEDLLERRKTVLVIHQPQEHSFLFYRYSSFWRLVRIIALVLRFLKRCRRKPNPYPHQLASVGELEHAKETLTKIAQQEMFTEEFKELVKTRSVSNKSSLRLVGPFLDEKGIIRLGGRLEHSSENYQTKHPMILPKIHPLTRLITKHYHELCMHSGPRMTLATMRQEFWPVNGKAIVNLVCRKCPQCFRQNPVPVTQPVGQLPQPRTAPCRAFTVVGVDYCGPVYTKPAHRRAAPRKAYIAVFVCFASKAVHLELVCDLSTEAFIAALRRFIAHHGMPTEIHSDNGTNFQGANNTLAELYRLFENKRTREAIVSECSKHRIQWHFIPPRAPSFGGLWEAAVKSAKTSLVKTLGNTQLSFEEYVTVLAQIEANMNSRPLTSLSSDPTELDVLTPGHFLIGSPLISLPDPDYTHVPTNRLNHYQQLQELIQQHWDRWRREYLTELNHQREKSSLPMDIRVGQTVLVQEDGKSSVSWPLARIEQIHPGADGVVRVATLRTASGTYKRPISRVFPLPYDNEPNDTLGTQIAKKGED